MAVDKALISGSMTMLLLRLLAEKDMYGYEMIDLGKGVDPELILKAVKEQKNLSLQKVHRMGKVPR